MRDTDCDYEADPNVFCMHGDDPETCKKCLRAQAKEELLQGRGSRQARLQELAKTYVGEVYDEQRELDEVYRIVDGSWRFAHLWDAVEDLIPKLWRKWRGVSSTTAARAA